MKYFHWSGPVWSISVYIAREKENTESEVGAIPVIPSINYFCIYVKYNNLIGRELETLVRILQWLELF